MSRYPISDEKRAALKAGFIAPERLTRNLVGAFQEAMREKFAPTYRVTGYRPLNAVNIRVTYTAPMWND